MFEEIRRQCQKALAEKMDNLMYEMVGAVEGSDHAYAKSLADRRYGLREADRIIHDIFKKFEEAEDGA